MPSGNTHDSEMIHGTQAIVPLVAESSLEPAVHLSVDWFEHALFRSWADQARLKGTASWGVDGHDAEGYPDIFVGVDPSLNGEGTDSDMPAPYWDALMQKVRYHVQKDATRNHILVRISPL
ncbi:hypothetical protein ACT3UJ_07025 [Halomonas sp. 86]|uniref:hypothetical protein n=1 Tax=unclassified Halomonas TaxID=2609666 RepID=UPI00403459AB